MEEKNGEYYKKDEISFKCHEDGHFYDSKNHALAPEDIECNHPEICYGQNITEAIDGFIERNKLLYEVNKALSYQTSTSKQLAAFIIKCDRGGNSLIAPFLHNL